MDHTSYIDNWLICISGFTQHEGRMSGLDRLQHHLHQKCYSRNTRILLKSWKDNMEQLADRIYNYQPPIGRQLSITIIGYSYGGMSGINLSKKLLRRGIKVNNLLLLDAVWRPYGPSILSLFPYWTIKVPNNVKNLWSWVQDYNKPSGHKIEFDPDFTVWKNPTDPVLKIPHAAMDEYLPAHEVALSIACPNSERKNEVLLTDIDYLNSMDKCCHSPGHRDQLS